MQVLAAMGLQASRGLRTPENCSNWSVSATVKSFHLFYVCICSMSFQNPDKGSNFLDVCGGIKPGSCYTGPSPQLPGSTYNPNVEKSNF